jgi:hypothetical protein
MHGEAFCKELLPSKRVLFGELEMGNPSAYGALIGYRGAGPGR